MKKPQPDSRSIRSRPLGPQRWEDGGSPWAVGHNHQVLTRTRAHLFCDVTEALVLPDALEGLSKERVERFVACSRVARPISGDREGCHPPEVAFSFCSQESRAVHEPLQWCGSQDGLVDEVAVLELLAQPLQGGEGLVQGDRHRDLAQVLPDVLAQQVPQVDALRLSLGDGQLPPKLPSNAGLPLNLQHFQPALC